MGKIFSFIGDFFNKVQIVYKHGLKWIGIDGLLNMETAALLTISLMIFFPVIWSMLVAFFIVVGKCIFDKSRGRAHELHDFICALIGVLIGSILGPAHAAVTVFG